MKDFALLLAVFAFFIYGYFVIRTLGNFIEDIQNKAQQERSKEPLPFLIMNVNDNYREIQGKINHFRREHSCTYLVVCDPQKTDFIDIETLRYIKKR